jgi:hypothetical protein
MRYIKTFLFTVLLFSFFLANPFNSLAQDGWETVTAFQGNGLQTTHPITILEDEWRLKWEVTSKSQYGNVFQVYLYDPEKNGLSEVLVNISNQSNTSSTTYVYRSGEYYFKINSANVDWKIMIQYPSD